MNEHFNNNDNIQENKDNKENKNDSNQNIKLILKDIVRATFIEKLIGASLLIFLYSIPILVLNGHLSNVPNLFFIHMGGVLITTFFIVYIHKQKKRDTASIMIMFISPIYIFYLLFGPCMFMAGI